MSDGEIVAKLTADLLPLKLAVASSEPLKDDVYSLTELQSVMTYGQSQAMEAVPESPPARQKPSNRPRVIRPFIGPDQAYKLATVLTERDLSEARLKPLLEALVGMPETAEGSRETLSPFQDSAGFRAFAERARDALRALGVTNHGVRIVMDALFRGAIASATSPPPLKYQ